MIDLFPGLFNSFVHNLKATYIDVLTPYIYNDCQLFSFIFRHLNAYHLLFDLCDLFALFDLCDLFALFDEL